MNPSRLGLAINRIGETPYTMFTLESDLTDIIYGVVRCGQCLDVNCQGEESPMEALTELIKSLSCMD